MRSVLFALLLLLLSSVDGQAADLESKAAPATVPSVTSSTSTKSNPYVIQLSDYQKKRIEKCDEEIAKHPDSAEAYRNRAYIYDPFFLEKAIPDYSKAIELEPTYLYALERRAKAYTKLGQYKEAFADYDSLIKVKPSSDAYYEKGCIYQYELEQPQQAIPFYNLAIGLDAFHSKAYASRGKAESDLGQNEKALKDLTKAIELNPRENYTFMYRAEVHDKLGQVEKAEEDRKYRQLLHDNRPLEFYIQGIAETPENTGLYYYLADCQMDKKLYEGALDTLTRIISANSNATEALFLRGKCWEKMHNLDKAVDDFTAAIKLDPTGAQAHRFKGSMINSRGAIYEARASVLSDLKRYQPAIDDYSVAITLDPNTLTGLLGRGGTYSITGHRILAVADKTQAIKLAPLNPLIWLSRARDYDEQRAYQKAWDDCNQAIQIMSTEDFLKLGLFGDPKRDLANGYKDRGLIAFKMGRKKDASADFAQAISLNPSYAEYIETELKWIQGGL